MTCTRGDRPRASRSPQLRDTLTTSRLEDVLAGKAGQPAQQLMEERMREPGNVQVEVFKEFDPETLLTGKGKP